MNKEKKKIMNRRKFLGYSALGLTGLTILPSWKMVDGTRIAPSDRVVLGFIGLGRQGINDFNRFSKCQGVQVAACCDVDSLKRERFKKTVEDWQKSLGLVPRCDKYEFYRDLLERRDIDAVSIDTPDHWHALIAIDACQAGKDIYVQKPLAFTISEGLDMVKAARSNNCIVQVGSQQRSSQEFQKAISIVQNGELGYINSIYVRVGDHPKPFDLPEQDIPASLNWNQWIGPLNNPKVHYHSDLCPPISLDPPGDEKFWGAWRWYRETGNGYIADWGAHMFDIAQAAIGMDGSGPCEFIPKGYKGTEYLTMKYQNGVVITEQPFTEDNYDAKGIKFNGTKGWLKVARNYIECSNPELIDDDNKIIGNVFREGCVKHMQNFIDSVRSREDPVAPIEVGCSTNTLCCIANIANELQRPVKWDPATLKFVDDKQADNHRLFKYNYRKTYSL